MAQHDGSDRCWSNILSERLDEYGGVLHRRKCFGVEVLAEFRRRVGRDFVVGARISGEELSPGGLGAADMAVIARRLAASGLVDFLSVIGGGAPTDTLQASALPDMSFAPAPVVALPGAIKSAPPRLPILYARR